MLSVTELGVRLSSAVLTGVLIGINRRMHAKSVGVRTLGLVSLGSAFVTLEGSNFSAGVDANASRVIQGLVTGIGFLGAGVIVKAEREGIVHGLTTAAAIWVTSAMGIACGLGAYMPVTIGLVLMLILLSLGGELDQRVHGRSKRRRSKHTLPHASAETKQISEADPDN